MAGESGETFANPRGEQLIHSRKCNPFRAGEFPLFFGRLPLEIDLGIRSAPLRSTLGLAGLEIRILVIIHRILGFLRGIVGVLNLGHLTLVIPTAA